MIGMITGLIGGGSAVRGWITIGLGAAVLLMGLAGYLLLGRLEAKNREIGALAAQLEQAVETAEHNAEMVRRQAQQHSRDMAAVKSELQSVLARGERVRTIIKEVVRARPEDRQPEGCPAVPAPLLRALDGVRQLRAAETDHQDRGPAPARP
jgi:hypothetical protein